jgi:methyltransferase (TIGR00027 family)
VGRTAIGVARIRAAESGRPDRLFDDPYAAAFAAAAADVAGSVGPDLAGPAAPDLSASADVPASADVAGSVGPDLAGPVAPDLSASADVAGSAGPDLAGPAGLELSGQTHAAGSRAAPPGSPAASSLGRRLSFQVVIRTRFFDDYLLAAAGAGIRQVVLLAAGLDTRAYRLDWPAGVRLFEVDLPEVVAFKQEILDAERARPRCERVTVPADLRRDWPVRLRRAGFDPGQRTAWLAEGLLIYLSNDEAAGLLTALGAASAAGSRLSCERGGAAAADLMGRAQHMPRLSRAAELWQGGLTDDLPAWLQRHGWEVSVHDLAAAAASYGRPALAGSRGGFVTATRSG